MGLPKLKRFVELAQQEGARVAGDVGPFGNRPSEKL
jgi:hypothetical protein